MDSGSVDWQGSRQMKGQAGGWVEIAERERDGQADCDRHLEESARQETR